MVLAGSCDAVSVTALCAELGISRQTYYRLRRRYLAEGPAGLAPRSRRPHSSPGAVDPALELEIIRLRTDEGWPDPPRGAASIADELRRSGLACPAVSTIHRVLVRNGLVTPQPRKRPRSSYTRFTYPDPNGCWQIDATRWELADGAEAWIMDVLDDHSRVVVAAHACPAPTSTAAQAVVHAAGQRWGLPARVLSDNGPCFGGVRRSGEFVTGLAALGIQVMHARPFHPQTCGKIERFHQTLKRWLRTQPRVETLAELQTQLDWFIEFYNHRRPHRALRGATPAEAWAARTPTGPPDQPIGPSTRAPARVSLTQHTVTAAGVVYLGRHTIGLGTRLAGTPLTAVRYGRRLLLLDHGGHPVRALTLLPEQRYYRQPTQPLLEPTPHTGQDTPHTGQDTPHPPGAGPAPAPTRRPGAAEAHSSRGARSTLAAGDARQGALEL
jgi:transposase InsO family protein